MKTMAAFTHWLRAAFVTGQSPIRTGLTKVDLPGARRHDQARPDDRDAAARAAT